MAQPADPGPQALLLERADAHLKLGELDDAERCYRLVLQAEPLQGHALRNLGTVLTEMQRWPEAVEWVDRALRVAPDDADAHYLRATLHESAGELAKAASHLEQVLAHRPRFEPAYRELVVACFRMGRFADASRWCARGLQMIPGSAELHFYLSNLHKHAHATDAAITSARAALKLRPGLIAARTSLRELLQQATHENADRAVEWRPQIASGYADLGVACLWFSDFAAAQAAFQSALALAPAVAEHHYNLGSLLCMQQDIMAAGIALDEAIALDPEHARARLARSLMCASPFPESSAAAQRNRTDIIVRLDQFSLWCDKRVLPAEQLVGLHSPFYLSYQELDNLPVFERYGSWCARVMAKNTGGRAASPAVPITVPPLAGRIKIGIVSADIRDHSVWFALIKGWIGHLDRKRFDIGIFSLTSTPDRETEWAQLNADFFVSGQKSLKEWMESIATMNPAVLIYPAIGLDILTSQLASLRLAPTQVNTWGHPESSGLPTIDLYLSGEAFEPQNAQRFYSEKLVPLLNLGNSYQRRVLRAVEPDLGALGIDSTRPIIICSGTAFKYQVENDHLLTQIARRTGDAQLIFFRQRPERLSDLLRERLERAFLQAGVDFDRHVRFIPAQPLEVFHGLLGRADVALDTIGFSGYNTAIQAIEAGLPLVTGEGRFLRGRLGSGILRRIGMPQLIAQSSDEYVDLAARLITDVEFRQRIRSEIALRRGALYDDIASIRHLEDVLEDHVKH